ncbi:MAG: antitoxin [Gemmatimonadota bacterium]
MSKRLQVVLDSGEMSAVQEAAARREISVSQYVREVLREARRLEPGASSEAKLLVVREAARHAFPTCDPEEMEGEINQGYLESQEDLEAHEDLDSHEHPDSQKHLDSDA